MLTSTNTTYIW